MAQLNVHFENFIDRQRLQPTVLNALRDSVSFMPPVILAAFGIISPIQAMMASFSAHSMCMLDIRGSYLYRFGILALLGVIMVSMSWTGAIIGVHIISAIIVSVFMAVLAGFLRHYLYEFGPGLATPAALLLFSAMAAPADARMGYGSSIAIASIAGSIWGIILNMAKWPIDPYYPLRFVVGECWVALSHFIESIAYPLSDKKTETRFFIEGHEIQLKQAVSRTQKAVNGRGIKRRASGGSHSLTWLIQSAWIIGTRLRYLAMRFEELEKTDSREVDRFPFELVLNSFSHFTRAFALALVSRRARHLREAGKALDEARDILTLQGRSLSLVLSDASQTDNLVVTIHSLQSVLNDIEKAVREVDRQGGLTRPYAHRSRTDELPDMPAQTFTRREHVQYGLHLAIALTTGTMIFSIFHLPHGYWIPFSSLVVLQPNMTTTQTRAIHRSIGTCLGAVVGSTILYLQPSLGVLLTIIAVLCGALAFYLKRHYAIGVFIVTILLVMQMEVMTPINMGFIIERLGCCILGSLIAFASPVIFEKLFKSKPFALHKRGCN